MRTPKLLLIFLLFILCSCRGNADKLPQNNSEFEGNNEQSDLKTTLPDEINLSEEDNPLPLSPSETPTVKPQNTLTSTPTLMPTSTFTLTPTIQLNCPEASGYLWSKTFSEETSFIDTILPAGNDEFLIGGVLDTYDGIWITKINLDGELIWQKKFLSSYASLKPATNGNFLIEFQNRVTEINSDGEIIKSLDVPQMLANEDGSYTIIKNNQVMRFVDPAQPLWQYSINNDELFGQITNEGGAVYAYAGIYADESVYYRPIYTDIKVIKIDGYGQVWQRVYGKLVGDETLDFIYSTADGGALLAGTHYYEQLGIDYDIWLMKINQTGSLSWQSTLKMAPQMDSISQIFVLSNGVLITSEDYLTDRLRLVKLNNNGSLAWQKEIYSIRGWVGINVVSATSDGGLVFAGESAERNNVGFLARFNSKGELLWEKLTGFTGIEQTPEIFIEAILPGDNGNILLAGGTNLTGSTVRDTYGAWITNMKDEGEVLGFLQVFPGKFSIISTMGGRPNTLSDDVKKISPISFSEGLPTFEETDFQTLPACLADGVTYPTPQALPSLTPSITPTPTFQRDLYLVQPDNMQGDDVLLLQQRLLELGYVEVGVPDGIFGGMTDNAVRLFQENNDLFVDGVAGPKTWNKLFSDSAKPKE